VAEVETILGYRPGRLALGMAIASLLQLPSVDGFELRPYSQIADHRFKIAAGLDLDKLKTIARSSWGIGGREGLVKVIPMIAHDPKMEPDMQYPPGKGAPQWMITRKVGARVEGIFTDYRNGRYLVSR
jgi:hypothetical protein